jgi:ferredoxin-NADP reductase
MKELKGRLIERIARTPTVESFRFTLPERAAFVPGQFTRVMFDERNRENKDLNKYLSFSSSPDKTYIEVTKRLSLSLFSRCLRNLKVNDEVLLQLPMGNCVFKEEYRYIGFLIGGIGITPVISIIEYIVERKLATDVILAYSSRTEEEIAFKPQLDQWRSGNANLKILYLVSECEPKDKTCIHGTITKDLLSDKICDLQERTFFIFGPPKMVEAMKGVSLELGCSQGNVKTESFIGY